MADKSKLEYINSLESQLEMLRELQDSIKDDTSKVFDIIKISNQIIELSAKLDKARLGQ